MRKHILSPVVLFYSIAQIPSFYSLNFQKRIYFFFPKLSFQQKIRFLLRKDRLYARMYP